MAHGWCWKDETSKKGMSASTNGGCILVYLETTVFRHIVKPMEWHLIQGLLYDIRNTTPYIAIWVNEFASHLLS